MVMSTPTLREASSLLASNLLRDSIQLLLVGEPTTVGYDVVRPTTEVGDPISALVQSSVLANAVESRVDNVYSIKVEQGVLIEAGMAVEVIECQQEPHLRGRRILVDKVSENGLALIRKATGSDFETVQQQGKEGI